MNVIAWILAIIGAINWGLVGFAKFDLVAWICGRADRMGQPRDLRAGRPRGTLVHRDAAHKRPENRKFLEKTADRCSSVRCFYLFRTMRLYPRLRRTMH